MEINITTPSTFEIEIGNSGNVSSVNGKVGTVVLNASDVHALPDTTSIPNKTSDLTNDSGFITSSYHDDSKQDVISDLSTIRAGATAGSTAVQPAAISDMATKTWTQAQGYLTQHQSLADYSTTAQMNAAISAYHDNTKQDVISDLSTIRSGASAGATAVQPSAITDMATKTWTQSQGYLTEHQSLAAYRTSAAQDVIDNGKQATLVSGTNIKTINSNSILGSGDIVIEAPTYTAGANVQISDQNVISATDTTYSAGTGILINNNVISADGSFNGIFYATFNSTYAQVKEAFLNGKFIIFKNTTSSEGSVFYLWSVDSIGTGEYVFNFLRNEIHLQQIVYITNTSNWRFGPLINMQLKMIAGNNISISGDGVTISATDTTYTAGTGINISNNVISSVSDLFICQYGVTEKQDILDAIYAGKLPICIRYSKVYVCSGSIDNPVTFHALAKDRAYVLRVTNIWEEYSYPLVPDAPDTTNTYVLKSVAGTLTWSLD